VTNATLTALENKPRPYVMAHRGNRVACPENTLAAFRRALADGADLLETDLHLSSDNHFVCIHDGTLDRTTNGTGEVAAKELAELKSLSASYGRAEFIEERIPTLSEVAALLPPDVALALELKTDRFLETEVCHALARELEQSGVRNRTLVISFSLPRVLAVQAAAPDLAAGWITLGRLRPIRQVRLLGPFWPILFFNPVYVWAAHRRGQVVCPLDPTPDRRLWWYRALRCDAVLTDNPEATCRALGRPAHGAAENPSPQA
jgi:glycerophosphoryl diester phosphodiesterase